MRHPVPTIVRHEKRFCARCDKQILRSHKWSAKMWLDDPRPRHLDCDNPALAPAAPEPCETEVADESR